MLLKSRSASKDNTARPSKLLVYAFLGAYALISIYPLVFAFLSSFKTDMEIFLTPFSLPKALLVENYIRSWELANVNTYLWNSILISTGVVVIVAFMSLMSSYILAKFKFKLSAFISILFMAGLMIPVQSTIVPLSYLIGRLQLKDNLLMVILIIAAFQMPISVMLMTSFLKSVPQELEEAAVLDGCNHARVLFEIVTPVSVPALVTVSVFNFLAAWNNILIPLIFISKRGLKPLSIGLLAFFGERTSDYSGVMAAIVIASILPFFAYILLQDKVEKGLTAGAVKG